MVGCFSSIFSCFKFKKVPAGVQVDWSYTYTIPIDPVPSVDPVVEPTPVEEATPTESVPAAQEEVDLTTLPVEPVHRPGMPSPSSVQMKQGHARELRRA